MTVHVPQLAPEPTGELSQAARLNHALRDASPAQIIATALETVGRERLALVSSFATESAALLKVMADVDPAIPVVFLDTGWLFTETLAYRDTLIAGLLWAGSAFAADISLLNVSYDPTRELYVDFNKAFAAAYQKDTGKSVEIK